MPADYLEDPHHRRAALRDLEMSIRKGWYIPDEANASIPAWLVELANDPTAGERERLRAAEVLNTMRAANLKTLETLDKMERLDTGQSTENSAVRIDYGDRGKQWTRSDD